MTMLRILFILIVAIAKVTHGFSDIGKWDLPLNGDNCVFTLAKSLFKDSQLIIMYGILSSDIGGLSDAFMIKRLWIEISTPL
ncbi:hypothetical protein HF086_015442 [Spodoptera exigua]|uniref:Uncharacterized protein n=1 Tax=Spodoptera exigua TaxID=7107 RepID=A0A922MWM3_SPOEX|nr:hypothetical protein HF086_015442 [Spodoptera exigua]